MSDKNLNWEWTKGQVPNLDDGVLVKVRFEDGDISAMSGDVNWWDWLNELGAVSPIVEYAIVDEPEQDSDGWIEWHGGEQPVDDGVGVDVMLRDLRSTTGIVGGFRWRHDMSKSDIIKYRVIEGKQKPEPTGEVFVATDLADGRDYSVSRSIQHGDTVEELFNQSGSKYLRDMKHLVNGKADVYAVLKAFNVTCPARQHAIKKLLCSGIRGKGDEYQDLSEARDAVARAMQMYNAEQEWEVENG